MTKTTGTFHYVVSSRADLEQVGPVVPNWTHVGVIYSRLFKYTQQKLQVLLRTIEASPPHTPALQEHH